MSRINEVRNYLNSVLMEIEDVETRRFFELHICGVSNFASLLALKRGENYERAIVSALLHDICTIKTLDSKGHGKKGALMAREILLDMGTFSLEEVDIICDAIKHHSKKEKLHKSFNQLLVDADVLAHCLYDPNAVVVKKEQERLKYLCFELGMDHSVFTLER